MASRFRFNRLSGPNGSEIASKTVSGNGVFDWVGRPIELFYIRYLEIKGLSLLSYEFYDERHVPERFRRPWTGEGDATGTWEDRPDHNKLYPDIAVPLELIGSFNIPANQNQSIWVDIYIPKSAQAGTYRGNAERPLQAARPGRSPSNCWFTVSRCQTTPPR
jgi:hypothetical protein